MENTARTNPDISQAEIQEIERSIAETAKNQADAQANNVAVIITRTISNIISECSNSDATESQMMDDIINLILIPTIKGEKVTTPKWMERAAVKEILSSVRDFAVRTQDRFTPLPIGSAKISPYQLEDLITEDNISLLCEVVDDVNVWKATDDTLTGSGKSPTEALNDFFRKKKASLGLEVEGSELVK